MAKDVICQVDSCVYWKNGNRCHAEQIEVNMGNTERAYKCDETNCKTFEAKPNL